MINRSEILNTFLLKWPIEKLQEMTLQEYSNLNKSDSFCYWLEAETTELGSIWGGSAFKFGIYEKNNKESVFNSLGRSSDDDYAWMKKYGETRDSAFQKVKALILEVANNGKNLNISAIDSIDLGDAVKWKIAYLYSDNKILNIFNKDKLKKISTVLGLEVSKKMPFSELQNNILKDRPTDEKFFDYGARIWDLDKENTTKNYWIYSPGEQAFKWDEFFNEGIIALGWDKLNDLNEYNSRDEITDALRSIYGGTGSKKNDTSANDDFANKMQVGDVILVKKGIHTLLGYGEISSDYYYSEEREDYKHCRKVSWQKNGVWNVPNAMVVKTLTDITSYNTILLPNKKYYQYLIDIMDGKIENNLNSNHDAIDLLHYKKQIILQGPPGTGKTRLAREIALEMIGNTGEIDLKKILKKGLTIPNASGAENYYLLENVTANSVELTSERATKKWSASFNKIQEKVLQLQRGESPKNKGGDDPYVLAVAKFVFENFKNSSDTLENNDQFKLIQFHPSYTYEDFVRGIAAKPTEDGNGIFYEAENKTLGEFAETANTNFLESTNNTNADIISDFKRFVNYILEEIDQNEKFMISETIYIFYVDEKRFKYKGDSWTTHSRGLNMNFSEIQKIISLDLNTRKEINKSEKLNALTRQHATYYQNFVELYKKFIHDNPVVKIETILKKYILIIDEINRANLSSVLGELIYALEYRGKEVESMYEVDGSQKIILPSNLYIIGTMNTADRSVGHIDYAIRRRFAFVEILPMELVDNDEIYFNNDDFNDVSALFNRENVSDEFEINDVQIGHSYFIANKSAAKSEVERDNIFQMKMKYEVIPILEEYVKDGILINEFENLPIKEYIYKIKNRF